MKPIQFIVLLFALTTTGLSSCKKYLTVNPKTEITQDKLFSTESGFKDALTGVYIQMKSVNAYGAAMSMTTIEQLTSSWDVTSNTTAANLGLFNYTDASVAASLNSIYTQEYTIIASVNAILGQIDAKKDVFKTVGLYEIIKSECLAIRAYCHMDVLRLFGPIPTDPTRGNMLAYVTTLSSTPNQRITFAAYQSALLKDLSEAAVLVKDIDPITQYSLFNLSNPGNGTFLPADTFMAYRYLRMNYYAVIALQSRAYLWFGDKTNAYAAARILIDAKNPDGTVKFALGIASDLTSQNYVLTKEHIFGLYDYDLYNKFTLNFSSTLLKKGSTSTLINTQLYGNTGTDIRESGLWYVVPGTYQGNYVMRKYQVTAVAANFTVDYKQIPLLRISEAYLIAAETGPTADAQLAWAAFRRARNIPVTILPTNSAQLQLEVLKEYRKEFYGEGQGFFAYKRVNASQANFLFAPSGSTVNYLIPLPLSESVSSN